MKRIVKHVLPLCMSVALVAPVQVYGAEKVADPIKDLLNKSCESSEYSKQVSELADRIAEAREKLTELCDKLQSGDLSNLYPKPGIPGGPKEPENPCEPGTEGGDGNESEEPGDENGDGNESEEPGDENGDGNESEEPGDENGDGNESEEPGDENGDGNESEEPGDENGDGNESEEPGDENGDGNESEEPGDEGGDGNESEKPERPEPPVDPWRPEPPTEPEIPVEPEEPQEPETPGTSNVSAYAKQVVEIVNRERAAQGLAPLSLNVELSNVATVKAEDMRDKNYFSHTSPTYGSPFEMMQKFGISYKSAGENIAKGQKTPESVMQAWMNSSGHKANILSSSYTEIGVGYVTDSNGTTYWVQMFIRP